MKKILVLEDNQDIRDMVTEVLSYEDFNVKTISSAAEFSPAIDEFQPHLVLLDLRLSDGHGGELCRALKSDPLRAHIPVIIFTAYQNPSDDIMRFGCEFILYKPFNITELINGINRLLHA